MKGVVHAPRIEGGLRHSVLPHRGGSVLLGECDRMGYSQLFTPAGRSVILPTTCKTWGCSVCRKKLLALFKARVQVGVSHLGRCVFITTTYQADNVAHQDALSVRKDWQALWRQFRRAGKTWSWLKVTELTKSKFPHHHIVLGPIEGQMRCHGRRIRRGADTRKYLSRMDHCQCMAHQFARPWLQITGDSFMCFATEVTDPAGAGSYMGKYMSKQFLDTGREGRRFSTSRCWPGGERLRLRQTLEGGWSHIVRWPASHFDSTADINTREHDLLERVGSDLLLELRQKQSRKTAETLFRKVLSQ